MMAEWMHGAATMLVVTVAAVWLVRRYWLRPSAAGCERCGHNVPRSVAPSGRVRLPVISR
jgi:hypothetical protein